MVPIEELLTRGVANIIPNKKGLETILRSEKKLNIYFGIDPTATKIHLGHAVPLRKLQAFAELGHHVTFLIGDFTALIGDTSDKDTERPLLNSKQIEENFQTYKQQAKKIIKDFSKIRVRYNSEWLNDLSFKHVLQLCLNVFSLNDFISRELIKKRLEAGSRIGLQELLYPVMQGYDSYKLMLDGKEDGFDIHMQIGGTDQTFNMQAGRTLIKRWNNQESFILATEFLTGTDGRKMSKSWGNAIWLDDDADDMYRKVMAITDDLIAQYYILATNVPMHRVREIEIQLKKTDNPMYIKKTLAHQIVSELHDINAAAAAAEMFERTVQKKEKPLEIPTVSVDDAFAEGRWAIDILFATKLASSRSEAKALIQQGGVEINNKKITDPKQMVDFNDGMIIKVGKRKFVRIIKS